MAGVAAKSDVASHAVSVPAFAGSPELRHKSSSLRGTTRCCSRVQGGCDMLTAFGTDGKAEASFKKQLEEQALTISQGVFAKAIYKLKGIGPLEACLVAGKYGSLGALVARFISAPRATACGEIAALQRASGRRVGPAAAQKLWAFCMSEQPDAIYIDKE